ncbi:MAG: efflux transporter outer membrane subunit [Methylococcaceae bacterium]|nr:efflux transporter outer membrane subunit [Methylococcaceae bacterium]
MNKRLRIWQKITYRLGAEKIFAFVLCPSTVLRRALSKDRRKNSAPSQQAIHASTSSARTACRAILRFREVIFNGILSAVITISLTLLGCAVGPDYQRPELPIPKKWSETALNASLADRQPDKWWKTFNDPVLDQLIIDATVANLDLKQALTRVQDARTQRSATIAAGLPSVSARSNLSRRFNNTTAGAGSQSGGSTVGGGFGVGGQHINIFQIGFDAQWELDFFGGVRRAVEAADANVDTEIENSHDVLITVIGEVARTYIDLRANQKLLAVAQENLTAQQDTFALTQVRQQAGLASMLDVEQARNAVANTEATIPVYQTLAKQAMHALGVLLGREPGALALRLSREGKVSVISSHAIVNLPSELLLRRPDIRRAERQMAAANAAVGVATAELYPKVNLAAFLGLQNMRITDFTPLGKSWSAASSISMPIFNWGKLNANIKSKKIQYEQSFLSYQSTVLNAFKEVEDALVANTNEQQRYQSLSQAVEADHLAAELSAELYQKGLTSFLNVLESQQALFQAQSNLVASEAKVASNWVALYKSLGGGWEN